jgi:hypothetical protein
MNNLNWNVILSGNRAISNNSFYPLPSKLIGSLMEKLYSSSSRKEELRSSENDINAGQRLRDTLSLKIQSSNTRDKLLFRNIKPDEFLKWDMMEQYLLEQAIVIMGKNDIEVLKTLDAVVHNEDGSLLEKANPNLSKEEISRFKTRLIDVYDSIFTSKNDKHRIALVTPPTDFHELPNHKQPVDEYMNELYKLLTIEQIFNIDMLAGLHEDYNSDYRCAKWSREAFVNLIRTIIKQKLKEEQRKNLLEGIEDKKNGYPHDEYPQ